MRIGKKLLAVLFATALAFVACGDDETEPSGSGNGSGGMPGAGGSGDGTGGSGGSSNGTGGSGPGGEGGAGGTPGSGGSGGGSGAGGAGGSGGAGSEGPFNYAFVTSTTHTGNLGGLSGADEICNQLAADAGLPGTYVAWLSDSSTNAIDRLGNANGWLRTDGRIFARSREALANPKQIVHPLILDENQEPVDSYVFTGTEKDGTRSENSCSDWTSEASDEGAVMVGKTAYVGDQWTGPLTVWCSMAHPIYCLGIDHDRPIPMPKVEGRIAFSTRRKFLADQGIDAADEICAREAEEAGLEGTFKALLGTTTFSPISRFSLDGDTWVRPDGVPIWDNAADALEFPPVAPLLIDAFGEISEPGVSVWLGAPSLDSVGTDTCEDWSSAEAELHAVRAQKGTAGPHWIQYRPNRCDFQNAALICLQE